MPDTVYQYDDPLDRLLRATYERDMWSYSATDKLRHAKLLGKPHHDTHPSVEDWTGGSPIFTTTTIPKPPRKVAIYVNPPEHFLWDSSQ